MSASAKRLVRLAHFDGSQEWSVNIGKNHGHTLHAYEAVERCAECSKRLAPGQHELCPKCDAATFDRLPLPTRQEERV